MEDRDVSLESDVRQVMADTSGIRATLDATRADVAELKIRVAMIADSQSELKSQMRVWRTLFGLLPLGASAATFFLLKWSELRSILFGGAPNP